jgi:hypothetical protein
MTKENLKIILDGVRQNYNTITDADNVIDGKSGTLAGIEIAFMAGYAAFLSDNLICSDILGLVIMGISTALLIFAMWPRTYLPIAVDPEEHLDYLDMPEEELLKQSISDAQYALSQKRTVAGRKASAYEAALILLLFSVFILIFI